MSKPHADDAGLWAVARVRRVRETDSRLGLRAAAAELRAAQDLVDETRRRISAADRFAAGRTSDFVTLRATLQALGAVLAGVEQERDQARMINDAALARWQSDRSRLTAIEGLLERRVAARRAEAARAEARQLDDLATQRWLRSRPEVA